MPLNGRIAVNLLHLTTACFSLNVINIFDIKSASTVSISQPSSVHAACPLAQRHWLMTFSVGM
ncbi:hypothetical protein [Novosphingobium sp. P6W]|uniref:hypothetical protein n=1 Tax=Novosphingobium sp. P6W TaxID=1609758 RepID=UPI0005C2B00B|nr:hypothetical protein [Novosphingobium sp. P6W]AXB79808.1 hypothetical protein TQ38_025670 [Novosphingobium sp. P6W]KIS30679.1 hypothetical protein TQ38_21450 [Novosphingobium sp. P6W]